MSEDSHLGLRLDRRDDQDHRSLLLAVNFEFQRIAKTPIYFNLRFFPRWEKDDSDAELIVGWTQPNLGDLRIRILAFDPFINGAYALAKSRNDALEMYADQSDLPLALALEAVSERFYELRTDLFLGRRLPARTHYRFPDLVNQDHHRRIEGWFMGGLLEWHRDRWPLWVGLSALFAESSTSWFWTKAAIPTQNIDEEIRRWRLYALGHLPGHFELEVSLRRQVLSSEQSGIAPPGNSLMDTGITTDGHRWGWLWSAFVEWMPDSVGAELGYMHQVEDRHIESESGKARIDQRLLTRCVLRLGQKVWARFGVGWDIDGSPGMYDGGGMTISAEF